MSEFWEVLTPVILSLMQEYQTPINFDDVNAILMKDASKFIIQHFVGVRGKPNLHLTSFSGGNFFFFIF